MGRKGWWLDSVVARLQKPWQDNLLEGTKSSYSQLKSSFSELYRREEKKTCGPYVKMIAAQSHGHMHVSPRSLLDR